MNPSNPSDLRVVAKFLMRLADMMDSALADGEQEVDDDIRGSKLTDGNEDNKVGFWSKDGKEIPVDKDWKKKNIFAYESVVKYLEDPDRTTDYKGTSICMVCRKQNGSQEFNKDGFIYPSGYVHYITSHNVVPDDRIVLNAIKANT